MWRKEGEAGAIDAGAMRGALERRGGRGLHGGRREGDGDRAKGLGAAWERGERALGSPCRCGVGTGRGREGIEGCAWRRSEGARGGREMRGIGLGLGAAGP